MFQFPVPSFSEVPCDLSKSSVNLAGAAVYWSDKLNVRVLKIYYKINGILICLKYLEEIYLKIYL